MRSSVSSATWFAKWATGWSGGDYLSVLVVLHEATRTGAPRVGGLIAGALKEYREVSVLCLSSGPLLGWLRDRVGADNVYVHDFERVRHQVSFNERVSFAKSFLER